jgi:hypothetical protein
VSSKSIPFEKFKEDWQRQLMADSTLSPVTLRVGIAISWHMNRKKGGLAFPGMAVCHEYRRSIRRDATVREMKEGPSRSAIRC